MCKPEEQIISENSLCKWCYTPLDLSDFKSHLVCLECYRLLSRAGIPDEEIFKPKVSDPEIEIISETLN